MKSKMERHIFQRSMKAGEVMDESAKPIHLNMLYDLARAFALANHYEAAMRSLSCSTVTRACGRASEAGFISYNGVQWDALHQCPVVSVSNAAAPAPANPPQQPRRACTHPP